MEPTVRALLTTWDLRLEVILVLGISGALYVRGWLRMRQRGRRQLASVWRLVSYLSGLLVLALALMSAIDILGGLLFFMHMIQHLLLLMVAPVLLLLAEPFPFIIWGLPGGGHIGHTLFSRHSRFRHGLQQIPSGGLLLLSVVFLWGWHDPDAYNAALRIGWVHDMQHLTFFIPGMLFWWKIIGAAPRLHGRFSPLARIALLLLMAVANVIPGVVIALASEPFYTYYLTVPRLWGLTALQDQMIGGVLMWIPGTMMYLLAVLVIMGRLLSQHEKQAVLADKSHYLRDADLGVL